MDPLDRTGQPIVALALSTSAGTTAPPTTESPSTFLTPGAQLAVRVLASLSEGRFLLALGDRQFIAASTADLQPGSTVRLEVGASGPNGVLLRLLAEDLILTSTAAERLARTGLPPTAAAAAVLAAFEAAAAPLDPRRLQAALDATVRTGAPPELASAHALLAGTGLPATPALVALALHATPNARPNFGAALAELKHAVTTAAAASPDAKSSGTSMAPIDHPVITPTALRPSPISAPPTPAISQPAIVVEHGPQRTIDTPTAVATSATAPGALAPQLPAPPAAPSGATVVAQYPLAAPTSPAAPRGMNSNTAAPAPATTSEPVPQAPTGQREAPRESAPRSAAALSRIPTITTTDRDVALRILADIVLPDPSRDGAEAVLRALRLAGVRPGPALVAVTTPPAASDLGITKPPAPKVGLSSETKASDLGITKPPAPTTTAPELPLPLARTLAATLLSAETQPRDPTAPTQPPTPLDNAVDAAVVRTTREQLTEQVFKPQGLADYDRVVPLPLAAQQLPTPARLAVASRRVGGGQEATFLRVDTELRHLGNVSVRMSGIEGGPLVVTIAASLPAGKRLAAQLPDLVGDLRNLGIEAAVRVIVEDPSHG